MKRNRQLFLARAAMTLVLTVLTTMTAWAEAVTLTEDTEETVGTAARWYVNLPAADGWNWLTLSDATVTSFKVYDDGGKSGGYSYGDHKLTLKAPEGYVLQLSGNITTSWGVDWLSVADDSYFNNSAKLLNQVYSSSHGIETAIPTVNSSGQYMTLYFHSASHNENNYAGLDLTVTLINTNEEAFNITVNNPDTGGTVSSDKATARKDETVTLTATPSEGYVLRDLSVTGNNTISVTDMHWTSEGATATFAMPATAVTVTPSFTNDLTSLYFKIPKTGTNTVTIPSGVESFKVYDDGGIGGGIDDDTAGNYSDNCDGTLVLTAPTGCVLQLSGTLMTEKGSDKLTVYDNNEASGTKLLDAVSHSDFDHTHTTPVPTVISSGRSMTLYFHSNNNNNYAGLDLTVTVVSTGTAHNITVSNPATGGTVSSDKATATVSETVTLTATPSTGYVLDGISVVDANSNAVEVTWNVWTNSATFTMPGTAVTVTPTFTSDLTSLSVNMPKTGTRQATIPAGVQSFKVYDDGGSASDYSHDCNGTLVLTAPTGYGFRLSGNITAETLHDKLTVYDGNDNTASKLLDAVSSSWDGNETAITTVTSSGQSMTLYFESDGGIRYAGLDLTVTVVPISYTITYDLGGGTADNPDSYTIESAAITLTNPTREGYDFAGWTGTGLAEATTTVTIASGSTGNRNYIATWTAAAVKITNGAGGVITDEDEITVPSLDYTRDFATPGATPDATVDGVDVDVYTLCLPYAPATGEGIKYYTLSGATVSALQFEEIIGSPVADTPYLVTVSAATSVGLTTPMADVTLKKVVDNSVTAGDFKFVGTTIGLTNAEACAKSAYILKSGNQWGPVMPATTEHPEYGNAYIPPFRAFIVAADSAPLLNTDFGSTTGIRSLQLIDQDGTEHWYDLQGHRLSQKPAQKGVYIHNNKKVVIK